MEEQEPAQSKYAGLSKGQIKKLKEKEKKEKEAASAPAAGGDGAEVGAAMESAPAAGKAAKGKKAKKGKGGLSEAAKKVIADRQAAEMDEKKLIAEMEAAEDVRLAKEEEARIAREAIEKAATNEKKRAKRDQIEELKKEGKYLTKKELVKKKIQDARLAAFFGPDGVPTQQADEENEGGKSTGIVRNKKKNKKAGAEKNTDATKDVNESTATAADTTVEADTTNTTIDAGNTKAEATPAQAAAAEESSDPDFDDWENAIDDIADTVAGKAKRENLPIAMVEGEEFSSDEEEKKDNEPSQTEQKAAKGKKKQAAEADVGAATALDMAQDGGEAAATRRARQLELLELRKRKQTKSKAAKLRCPIVCIMGHVDTGKTLILDKLRKTNVQANEAGGITQQIGATYFPPDNLQKHITVMKTREELELELPGFLVIDTPGHESFTNLRSRGSSLCDLAVLVVDIMHGLENQTIESLNLLKSKNVPFCIALNKIDRLNRWVPKADANSRDTLDVQEQNAMNHFEAQLQKTVLAFNEQGFNVSLYWENESPLDTLSFVPTSAITGEGLSDLIFNLCKMGQTTERDTLTEKAEFECTVLEVKVIEGLGTTIDVVLVNGVLHVGDTIVISGLNGPIKTNIRALLTPFPMKEMRVKGEYQHHQKIKGAMGIKISAPGLECAIAGSELFRCDNEEQIQDAIDSIEGDLVDILEKYVDKTKEGVCVQASTIGSLEALLEFLYQSQIPVCAVNIGPVHKKDVLKAMKSTTTANERANKEYACMLAFDVKVMPDAQNFSDENGIKVFTAKIIYHLFDEFTEYVEQCKKERKMDKGLKAVFPCILEMVPDACFHTTSPIVIGVNVVEGLLKVGTPLCVPDRDNLKLGIVQSIEANKKPVTSARAATGNVAVKIVNDGSIMYGRHFDHNGQICSMLTRDSIDVLKTHFRDEMTDPDWRTCIKLKKLFDIA